MLCSLPSNRFFSGPPRDEACAQAAAFWYVAALRRAAEWILGAAVGLAVAVLIMLLIGILHARSERLRAFAPVRGHGKENGEREEVDSRFGGRGNLDAVHGSRGRSTASGSAASG